MKESEFQQMILDAFEGDKNILLFRQNTGGVEREHKGKKRYIPFGTPGQSDLWGVIAVHHCPFCNRLLEGTFFGIELKSDKGKLSPLQRQWLQRVARYNGIAMELRPCDVDLVRLRQSIVKLLTGQKCSLCVAKSKMTP